MNQAAYSLTHSHWSYYSCPFPLLGKSLNCGTPLGGSQERIKLPFCPVGQGLTEDWLSQHRGLTESRQNCQVSWSTSPWSPNQVKTTQRFGTPGWRRTQNTIRWHATSFGPKSLPTLVQSSHWLVAQVARMVGISLGPPKMLWKYCHMRNQGTLREVENSHFYFTPPVPDELTLRILGPKQRIHRMFKGQCRASGYKKCVKINRWASAGLETWGCLDKSSRGDLLWKVYLQKETKEGGNGQLSLHGALCHDLTSNFSHPKDLPEIVFLFNMIWVVF
jgi:hypothetical protein